MGKVGDFLNELATDTAKRAKFDKDPDGAMEDTTLTANQKKTIKEGTLKDIRGLLKKEGVEKQVYILRMSPTA